MRAQRPTIFLRARASETRQQGGSRKSSKRKVPSCPGCCPSASSRHGAAHNGTTIENRCQARRFGQSRSRTSNSREVSSDRLQETSDWRPATQTAKRERNVRRNTHPTRSLPADRFQNNRYSIHSLHEQHVLQFLQQFVREFVDFVKDGAKYTNPPAETAGAERCNCAFSHRLRKKKGGHRLYRKRCHRDSSCERKTKTRCLQQCHFVRNGSCRRQKTTSYALPICCAATTCVEIPAVDVAFSFGYLRAVVF